MCSPTRFCPAGPGVSTAAKVQCSRDDCPHARAAGSSARYILWLPAGDIGIEPVTPPCERRLMTNVWVTGFVAHGSDLGGEDVLAARRVTVAPGNVHRSLDARGAGIR